MWLSLGCYEYSSTQDQEIGHLCYVLMWIGAANLSLAYNHPTQRLKLQRIEGRLMVLLGSTAITSAVVSSFPRIMTNQTTVTFYR